MAHSKIRVLITDVGGVLGTNGWDTELRDRICQYFNLNSHDIALRHRMMFDSFERGYTTFERYLEEVFCTSGNRCSMEAVRDFAFNLSIPWPENIDLLRSVKNKNKLVVGVISNEGSGLTEHRVKKFGLRDVADFMIFSHFVHLRKPDPEIWRLALNLVQSAAEECIYVDDRKIFADLAGKMGFQAIHHVSLEQTRQAYVDLGLEV